MTWTLDGVNLSSLATNVKHRAAGWSIPSKSGNNIKVPGRHGTFFRAGKTFDEGHLTLSMWAAGCNEDGTIPNTEDGSKKVRDNLDNLSALFATSNRLLNLRKRTGTDMPLINEMSNPQMTSNTNTGYPLATNYLVNSDRSEQKTVELSRNVMNNPYLKGRSTSESLVTEDVFPDPAMWQHSKDAAQGLVRGWFYPVNQDEPFTNFFTTPYNGFSYITNASGRGVISLNRASPSVWPTAHIAYIGREVQVSRTDKVFGFFRLRLAANASANEVNVRIEPSVSLDKTTWTNGTSVTHAVSKDGFTEFMIPASNLPAMSSPTATGFHVRYLLTIVTSASWKAGEAFEVSRIAIQDSPEVGNPWVTDMGNEHVIVGGQTTYVKYTGSTRRSASHFTQIPVPGWEKVNTGNKSTTAPYGYVWNVAAGIYNEAQYAFSVFGGTQQTFRKVLPSPVRGGTDYRIWGKCWEGVGSTLRVVRRTGSAGSYTYTQVGTVTITGGRTFVSSAFTMTPGETYCIEVTAPSGDGFRPALVLRELHISNGLVDTKLPLNVTNRSYGTATRSQFSGTPYASPVHGYAHTPALMESGISNLNAISYLTKSVNMATQPDGAFVSPSVDLVTQNLPLPPTMALRDLTVNFTASLTPMSHLTESGFSPGTGTLGMTFTFQNASSPGGVREVTRSFTGVTPISKSFGNVVPLQAGDTGVKVTVSYSNAAFPLSTVSMQSLHLMVNLPEGMTSYTAYWGSENLPWAGNITWTGSPFFSASSLTTSSPTGWEMGQFEGVNEDDGSLRFKGTKIRVPAALQAGPTYIGFRRGASASFQVQVQTQGMSSPTTLGSVSGSVSHVQGLVTLPQASSYVDYLFTDASQLKSVRDVFAISNWKSVYPIPSSSWAGFTSTSTPALVFPTHPSHLYPLTSTRKLSDGTTEFSTGTVAGWSGPVMHGGYLQVPESGSQHVIASNQVAVNGGYVSAGIRIHPTADAVGKVHIEVQAATNTDASNGDWTIAQTHAVASSSYHEVKLVDVNVAGMERVRLVVRIDNRTSPLTRNGITGIVDGVALTPTPIPVGSNFPGYFVGVRASNGTSTYRGDIRQCWVEVNETIDMDSMAYGTIAEFNVLMTVPGAFWEDVYDTQTTVVAQGSSTSGTFLLSDFEGATAPMADLTYEIEPVSGTITDLRLEDMGSGAYIVYRGPARTKITLDTNMATVTDETGNSIIRYVPQVGSSSLLSVSPYRKAEGEVLQRHRDGVPVLKWSSNRPIRITITGRRKYLIG